VIQAKVVRVADGDTLRVRHQPGFILSQKNDFRGRLTDETLLIRLAGVDAPETAKRGEPGQPFADEATDFVAHSVLDKKGKRM